MKGLPRLWSHSPVEDTLIDKNVNSGNLSRNELMAEVKKRVRRTPEEARALILKAARKRLQGAGPEGLQVKEVAAVAGVAHSTVLHHFGSAEGLRNALIEGMGHTLLEDILKVIKERGTEVTGDNSVLLSVFETLSDAGHARLLAWMMLKGDAPSTADIRMQKLFHQLIEEIAGVAMHDSDDQSEAAWRKARRGARFTTMLAATAAVGDGVSGKFLAAQIGLTESEANVDFRLWLAELLNDQG
jgi:AcrR family transcriptional regulator